METQRELFRPSPEELTVSSRDARYLGGSLIKAFVLFALSLICGVHMRRLSLIGSREGEFPTVFALYDDR